MLYCHTNLINLRKLAAIDILFLGSRIIIGEFAGGVLLCAGMGVFVLLRSHSFGAKAFGIYLIALGINYIPMLIYALSITKAQSALAEISDELDDKRRAMAKYRRQSLLLLVPVLVPILALKQIRRS
jgi:hypothetical protein